MKLNRIMFIVIMSLLVAAFFFSCTTEGDQLPEYYVLFYVDGELFVFDMGYSEFEDSAYASQIEQDPDYYVTRITAAPEDLADKTWSESTYIAVQADGITTGTYISDGYVLYKIPGSGNTDYECTVTLTEYGEVGGIIAGTFSTSSASFPVSDGEFRVIRAADDSYILWPDE